MEESVPPDRLLISQMEFETFTSGATTKRKQDRLEHYRAKKAATGSSIAAKINDNDGESETFVPSSVSSSAVVVSNNNNNRYIENTLNDYRVWRIQSNC